MLRKRGRPKFRNYGASFHMRMPKPLMLKLKLEFDRFCVASGQYDRRGNRRSFNEFLLKKLKGE